MFPALPLLLLPAAAEPRVLLYTMGAGDDLLSRWGHAALCVLPEGKATGPCYDFGHTDYGNPTSVVWAFFRGTGRYWAEVEPLPRLVKRFHDRDQAVWSQVLDLPLGEATRLAGRLERLVNSDENFYLYHHFHDNCSTRLRDLVDDATGGALRRDNDTPSGPTYRSVAEHGLSGFVPLQVMLELGLGRDADRSTSPWEGMLHPDVLRAQVQSRLGAQPKLIFARAAPPPPDAPAGGRIVVGASGPLLALWSWLAGRRDPGRTVWRVALGLGLTATCFWTAALLTALPEIRWNEVLLCLWPTDLLLPAMSATTSRKYLGTRAAGLLLVTALWLGGIVIQPLGPVLLLAGVPLAAVAWARRRG